MRRLLIMLLISCFAISSIAGCGQNRQPQDDKKPIVIKPEEPAVDITDDEEASEKMEEASEKMEEAPKAITEPAIEEKIPEASVAPAEPIPGPGPGMVTPKYSEEIIAANFDSGEKPNNLGGNFGAWNKDPSDPTQWCKESFDNVTRHGDAGFAMKLDYSVDSPNPAYNGFWTTLPNFDATKYDALNLWVKGDPKIGYTTVFKIELKNANKQLGRYYVSNVGDQWQEISIPLSEFKGLIDKSSLTEFVIVFEDRMASNKKGVLYIDDIRFVRK